VKRGAAQSIIGRLLTIAGLVIIFAGILTSLHIYFKPTTLFNTLLMIIPLVGGIGLGTRSLRLLERRLARYQESIE
jgi:hypothetical protein